MKEEMKVLESSFQLERQQDSMLSLVSSIEDDEDNEDIIKLTPESAEAIRVSMERYIRERQ